VENHISGLMSQFFHTILLNTYTQECTHWRYCYHHNSDAITTSAVVAYSDVMCQLVTTSTSVYLLFILTTFLVFSSK